MTKKVTYFANIHTPGGAVISLQLIGNDERLFKEWATEALVIMYSAARIRIVKETESKDGATCNKTFKTIFELSKF